MKVVILAGGQGTRIGDDEWSSRPKPMEEIGGRPILLHILKLYSHYGITEFVICLGSRGYMIKEFFKNYFLHTADVTFDLQRNDLQVHDHTAEPWKVTLVDTGENTGTGGRLKKIASHLAGETTFCMTYGDNVSNVNIDELVRFHESHRKLATLTAVHSVPRFGVVGLAGELVERVQQDQSQDLDWLNGGFYVLSTKVLDFISDDPAVKWENEPLDKIARDGQLNAFRHSGFWQPMDTLRDKQLLENLWQTGSAPWKIW